MHYQSHTVSVRIAQILAGSPTVSCVVLLFPGIEAGSPTWFSHIFQATEDNSGDVGHEMLSICLWQLPNLC